MNSSSEVSTPRSCTTKPAPRNIMMHRFFPISCRSPLTVPITATPIGSIPEAERIGSICAMPAFIARAQARTSGTKIKFSRNFMPTIAMPAIKPLSMTSEASMLSARAWEVSSSTVSWLPSMRAAEMFCICSLAFTKRLMMRSISSGRSINSSISSRMNSLAMSFTPAMVVACLLVGSLIPVPGAHGAGNFL